MGLRECGTCLVDDGLDASVEQLLKMTRPLRRLDDEALLVVEPVADKPSSVFR